MTVDFYDYNDKQKEWSYSKLLEKYEHLVDVTIKNIPSLWPALEFVLSIKTILNIKDCTLPFMGILMGPASSNKTVAIELFRESDHTFYTDSFSPKSLVSHISGMTEEQLRKIDLLPRLKNKFFLTPELGAMLSSREDDLRQILGILTRILDGRGGESDSGAQGHRGYNEEIMFTWVGASVEILPRVYKMLSTLGPKIYFFRLPRREKTEGEHHDSKNADFKKKTNAIRRALFGYLEYFEANPAIVREEGNPLSKVQMDESNDGDLADRIICRVGILLSHLRATVPMSDNKSMQGADYAYTFALIEDPTRAITQLRNLARGHALSKGRTYFTMDDIPIIIHTALSTASMNRVRIFELLIARGGTLTTNEIVEYLNTTAPTARDTMTELKATELVTMKGQNPDEYNSIKEIRLKDEFKWFLSDQFKELKERALEYENILLKEKCTLERHLPMPRALPLSLYDQAITTKNILSNIPLLRVQFAFNKNIIQKHEESESNYNMKKPVLYPEAAASIYNTGIRLGSQLILFRNPMDFFLSMIHPGILDNSLNVEFVTNKMITNPTVQFLKKQTPEYGHYYACYHCYDYSKATFGTIDKYERHIVMNHKPATVGYPGYPDREKLELERVRNSIHVNMEARICAKD